MVPLPDQVQSKYDSNNKLETIQQLVLSDNISIALRLPHEILVQIFTHCLPEEPLDVYQPNTNHAPLLICHVCSDWRSTALAAPTLWNRVYLSCFVFDTTHVQDITTKGIVRRSIDRLCWWIRNANPAPLSIRLRFKWIHDFSITADTLSPNQVPIDRIEFICNALSGAKYLDINRLCAASLRVHPTGDGQQLLKDFSNLETFMIRDMPYQTHQPAHALLSESFTAIVPLKSPQPRIRRLFLERYTIYLPDTTQSISWNRLTHICVVEITIQLTTWFVLIRQLVQLETGRFGLRMESNETVVLPPPIKSLENLRQLHLEWTGSHSNPHLLDNLHLPKLTALRIDAYLTIPGLHRILKWTPNVQELHLSSKVPWSPRPGVRPRFLYSGVEPLSLYVPQIEHLLIAIDNNGAGELEDRPEVLEQILASRWLDLHYLASKRRPLSVLQFSYDSFSPQWREKFGEMCKEVNSVEGLDVGMRKDTKFRLWTMPSSLQQSLETCFDELGFTYA